MNVEVLLLSSLYDFSTDLVCEQLHHSKTPFLRINRETLHKSLVQLEPTNPTLLYSIDSLTWEVGASLRSVWYRQPVFLRNTPGAALSVDEQLNRSQWAAFIRGLTSFDRAKWINHPRATYLAECKPYQLRRAKELGFLVPRTLVTNDQSALRDAQLGSPFALKSLDTVLLREGDMEIWLYPEFPMTLLGKWWHGYPRSAQPEAGPRRAALRPSAPRGRASTASGCAPTGRTGEATS